MVRHNNLPNNLPQLQNLIKRNPESYKDEFLMQYRHFLNCLEVFALKPNEGSKDVEELVMFIAQVAQNYPDVCSEFPQQLVNLLRAHASVLDSTTRNCFVKALVLMRNKNLIDALSLLELCFELVLCPDKSLRIFLRNHIINDIKNMNAKHKNVKTNTALQNFMYSVLNDANPKAAKMAIDIMIDLYKKKVWNDEKTVNVIAIVGCFSKIMKVLMASLKFFLGHDDDSEEDSDSDNEIDLKSVMMQNRVNKKTKKRKKQLEQLKKQVVKSQKDKKKPASFNYSAIHLIHNPQGMAEGLLKELQGSNDRFETKLMYLDVISRLIGVHQLYLFGYYSFITRFLQPHQRQVTRILQFAAQASHELVPSDAIEPVLKTIANNFITERNSSDVMAIGLNATREICKRCPLAMTEDLLRDLALYKTYKEKSVMMAAKSLISLYREQLPNLLSKKDRGRLTEAQAEKPSLEFGKIHVHETVPGAEALLKKTKSIDVDEDADSDGDQSGSEASDESDYDDDDDDGDDDDDDNDEENTNTTPDDSVALDSSTSEIKTLSEKEAAKEIASTRIFTDEDYKILNAANLKKKVTNSRKRPLEEDEEFVKLANIEMIYKKRKHDKESRLETVKAGRQDREKFGYKDGRKNINCSKTNREKLKKKNPQMIRHKVRSKAKNSFKDRQRKLRNHLLHQKKMK